MAQVFNNCADIGIVFNAYNFGTGEAVLFGNERAKGLWPTEKSIPTAAPASGVRRQGSAELALQQITAEAVESALWLSRQARGQTASPSIVKLVALIDLHQSINLGFVPGREPHFCSPVL
jgi:hypothetical protein